MIPRTYVFPIWCTCSFDYRSSWNDDDTMSISRRLFAANILWILSRRLLFCFSRACASELSRRSIWRRKEEIRLLRRHDRVDFDPTDDNNRGQFKKVKNAWPCYTYSRTYLRARYLSDIINDPHPPWLITSCIYFAVTQFCRRMNNTVCDRDPNQRLESILTLRIFLVGRPDLSLLLSPCGERKFNHYEGGNACAGNYPHETHSGRCTLVKVSGSVIIIVGLV